MILQSKMNYDGFCSEKSIQNAKNFCQLYELNKWFSISEIPASIVGEIFMLWDSKTVFENKIIEIDETHQYFKIIRTDK